VINNNHGPIYDRFRDMACYSLKLSVEIATKPLQMEIWLLLIAYRRRPPAPYLIVPSPTPYDLLFSNNTARLVYVRYNPLRSSKANNFHVI